MTREDYIKVLISDTGYSVKSFATSIGLPYSTLRSILNGGVGGAAVDNVIMICKGLGITVDALNQCGESNSNDLCLTSKERKVIMSYRSNASARIYVDKLLDIEPESDEQKKHA